MTKLLRWFPLVVVPSLLFGSTFAAPGQKLDTTTFVVVGGGLAAGMAELVLTADSQAASFPALLAQQMNTLMPLPLFREGGTATELSYRSLAGNLPAPGQSTLRHVPFPLFTFNPSVPFIKVSESIERPAAGALIVEGDIQQSLFNLILGYPVLLFPAARGWSQVDYATLMAPTFVVVELGFGDVADAFISGDPSRITAVSSFQSAFAAVVRQLKGTSASILLMNVPDPTDTAFAVSIADAARLCRLSEEELRTLFGLAPSDLVTLSGLEEIGDVIRGRTRPALSPRCVVRASVAAAIRSAVEAYNSFISSQASANGLPVFDTNALYKEVRRNGIKVGASTIGGGFGEGFYSQDGIFPTRLGQALVANRLLEFINRSYQTSFRGLGLEQFQDTGEPISEDSPVADSEEVRP